jgi:predicted dinucleotide-utilizing enzyme
LVPASARCGSGELAGAVSRFGADVVIEVCHPDVSAAHGSAVLRAGADFVCGSPTALADASLLAALLAASAGGGGGLYVPAGALWGARDIARLSARGALAALTVTMKKHPASLKLGGALGAALAAWVASGPPAGELVLYEGPVRALCPLAPNNVNTMAAAALAAHDTLGFDGVTARLVADASLDAHVITVDVVGPAPAAGGAPFRALTERVNPAPPGAVTGAATFAAVWGSLLEAGGRGPGLHMC